MSSTRNPGKDISPAQIKFLSVSLFEIGRHFCPGQEFFSFLQIPINPSPGPWCRSIFKEVNPPTQFVRVFKKKSQNTSKFFRPYKNNFQSPPRKISGYTPSPHRSPLLTIPTLHANLSYLILIRVKSRILESHLNIL